MSLNSPFEGPSAKIPKKSAGVFAALPNAGARRHAAAVAVVTRAMILRVLVQLMSAYRSLSRRP